MNQNLIKIILGTVLFLFVFSLSQVQSQDQRKANSNLRNCHYIYSPNVREQMKSHGKKIRAARQEETKICDVQNLNASLPKIKMRYPKEGNIYQKEVPFSFRITNWDKRDFGNKHILVAIDDFLPFEVPFNMKKVDLLKLFMEKNHSQLKAGTHFLKLYITFDNYNAIRDKSALLSRVFHIKKKSEINGENKKTPSIVGTLPSIKCVKKGDINIDFILSNIELNNNNSIQVAVASLAKPAKAAWVWGIYENKPYQIRIDAEGEYEIVLALVKKEKELPGLPASEYSFSELVQFMLNAALSQNEMTLVSGKLSLAKQRIKVSNQCY